ncbi:hypothetical protein B0H13DRAFT_1934571 [Mycena leptocephala]|nr:hypothetical protein B0H13DRAFT_1934571 [Mycena leptocephala]
MALTIKAIKSGTQFSRWREKAGGQGVNVRLSHPVGCTEEVKDLFKKQTMFLCAVKTVDSGDRAVIIGSAMTEDLIISVKANILRWTETGFFPNSSNLAMRVSFTRLDTVKGGLSNSRKKNMWATEYTHWLVGSAATARYSCYASLWVNYGEQVSKPFCNINTISQHASGGILDGCIRLSRVPSWILIQ